MCGLDLWGKWLSWDKWVRCRNLFIETSVRLHQWNVLISRWHQWSTKLYGWLHMLLMLCALKGEGIHSFIWQRLRFQCHFCHCFYTKRQNMVRGKLGEAISKPIGEKHLALLRFVYNKIGKKYSHSNTCKHNQTRHLTYEIGWLSSMKFSAINMLNWSMYMASYDLNPWDRKSVV